MPPPFRRSLADETEIADINITPLVDVVLVLLVIFMITAPMMKAGVDVNLPKGENAAPMDEKRFVVHFTKDKKVFVDEDPVHEAVVADRLAELAAENHAVYLKADAALSYGDVMTFMDKMKSAGIETVALVMEPLPKSKKRSKR